jgi:TolB protein
MHPAWSPEGSFIAFASERTGSGDIYVMRADGSEVRRLTEHPAYEGAPSWSPDGKWIAFEGERDGRSELYRVEVATGKVERLTESLSRKLGPDYSPDGTHLAYMNRSVVRWQVALLDLASGQSDVLSEGWGSCRPDFSPDGRLLAFVSTKESNKADIRLRDMARETDWKLESRRNAHNYDPSFSPDGMTVVFASTVERRPEKWDLYLVDINGRNLKPLTPDPSSERFPDWRPSSDKR